MMYIIFNHDGSIKEKNLNEFIQQGDNLTKKIAVAIIGYEPLAFSLIGTFKLLNGDTEVLTSDESIEIQGYPGVVLSLTEDVTSLAGIVRMNIQAVNTSDVVLVSYSTYLTINEGDNPGTVAMMSIEQYQYLLSQIGDFVQKEDCILKTNHRLTSTEGFEEGQVIYVKNESLNQLEQLQSDSWVVIFDFKQIYTKTEIDGFITTLNSAISQKSTVSGTVDSHGKWNTLTIDGVTHQVGGNGANYQAGTGITIVDETISVDEEVVATQEDLQEVREVAEGKCKTYVLSYSDTISSIKENVGEGSYFLVYNSTTKEWEHKETELLAGNYDNYTILNANFNSQNSEISGTGFSEYLFVKVFGGYALLDVSITTSLLQKGDIILVIETEVPDRWVDGVSFYKLETSKVDLTNYLTFTNLNTILGGILCGIYLPILTYALNDIVIYDNKLYKCTTAITQAEAWNSAHWTQIFAKNYFVNLYQDQVIYGHIAFTNDTTFNQNLTDGSNSYTVAESMAQFNPNDTGLTEIKWSKMLSFDLTSSTTFSFETAKTNCLNEYKAIINNTGSAAITLTFTGVNHILCNDDNITIATNTLTLPSGTSIEISCLNGNLVAINFNIL